MDWKIPWDSGVFEEINLVYEKAEDDGDLAEMLSGLEEKALGEVRMNVGSEMYETLSLDEKEQCIAALSEQGLALFNPEISEATFYVRLSAKIQKVLACTFFNILNRIENLDGAVNLLSSNWKLEIAAPLGGKKGLAGYEMLIMMLYPWISVREISTQEIAETVEDSEKKTPAEEVHVKAADSETKAEEKTDSSESEKDATSFYKAMKDKENFMQVFDKAVAEFCKVVSDGLISVKYQGKPLNVELWELIPGEMKIDYVLMLGNNGVTLSTLICIDYAELFPNCIALILLYSAWTGQLKMQAIDAGDDTDVTKLAEALNTLYPCVDEWDCTILSPDIIYIGK